MTIEDATKATRKYCVSMEMTPIECFGDTTPAQAACDRLNLIAVLEAIREPSDKMKLAGFKSYSDQEDGCENPIDIWRAMIDALFEALKA